MWFIIYFALILACANSFDLEKKIFKGKESVPPKKYVVKLETTVNRCSGSIIGSSWIISAAHCFKDKDPSVVEVYHDKDLIAQVKGNDITIHPSFQMQHPCKSSDVDIALLRTQEEIVFTELIGPIQLASTLPNVGKATLITGYGLNDLGLDGSATEGVAIIEKCLQNYNHNAVCSQVEARGGRGDSGGAMVCKATLVGVLSCSCRNPENDQECELVCANVPANSDWILKIINSIK